jgi:sec-independent protein translocase protein TatA
MLGFDNPIHLVFLLGVLLLVFGAKRLPEMGRSLGSGMRGFRDSISGEPAEVDALARHGADARTDTAPIAAPPQDQQRQR